MLNLGKQFSFSLVLCVTFVVLIACSAPAQTPQKTVHSPDGWVVRYGVVDGATTQSAAIVTELRSVAKSSGDSPLISRPFRYKGTNTVGVFYVVRDHSARNVPMIGLILSDFNDKKQVETALMYDTAQRFPSTLKSMMETVFKEWRPGGVKPAANVPPTKAASSGKVPPLYPVTLSDGTASAKIPDGWQVQPGGHLGTMGFKGPHQEFVVLNAVMQAEDPRGSAFQTSLRMGIRPQPGTAVLPYDTDWVKAFPNVYLAFAQALRLSPTDLKIDHAEVISGMGSRSCVQGQGHVDNNNGTGLLELNAMYCPEQPEQPPTGLYLIFEFVSLVPSTYVDQERATVAAVFDSYQWDEAKARSIAAAQAAPMIAAMNRVYQDHMHALTQFTQSQIERTHEIGRQADARYAEADRQRVMSSQAFNRQEENIGRYGQGFSDYILDQSVIQYSDYNGNVYHERVPNDIAYNLVQHHSDKIEIVDTPNYIPNIDFVK